MGKKKQYFVSSNKGYYQTVTNSTPEDIKWGSYFLVKKPGEEGVVRYCTNDHRLWHGGDDCIQSGGHVYAEKYCKLLEPVVEEVEQPAEGLKTFIWHANVNNAPGLLIATAQTIEEAKKCIIGRAKSLGTKRIDDVERGLKNLPTILNPGKGFIHEA